MTSPIHLLSPALLIALTLTASPACAQQMVYPESKRVEHFDEYHGTRVHDPYRWLEDDVRTSEDVANWVEAQNEVTFDYLEQLPWRAEIQSRLTELWNYGRQGAPERIGSGKYVYSYNDGLQNQSVVYITESFEDGEADVLFDPNEWSEDGTVALQDVTFSRDGRYVVYGIAEAGSDWKQFRIRNVETGEDLPEMIRWVKFSGAEWSADGKGFFYSRYDEPQQGAFVNVNKFNKLYYHRLGTEQSEDVLVYHNPAEPDWGFGATATDDGRYLVITVWKGTDDRYRILYRDLHEPFGYPVDLIDTFENDYTFIANDGPVFYFKTNHAAPRGRIIAIDTRTPGREHWREVVAESADTLVSADMVANVFTATYLKDARSAIRMYRTDGTLVREVDLPGIGTASGFTGRRSDTETFYSFASFATPPSNYRYDMITGESELIYRAEVDIAPEEYVTKQVFYPSRDGTRVPMFITHKRGMALDGANPTLLYGYGGFNIPMTPHFSIARVAWMEMGGVYAVANLRGGGEYGKPWHQAGTKLQKQNVFDDFIAASEWLIDNGYTQPRKLAIMGGSNGGLLVGACMTQRPDLFGACLPAVGVMDMLRFHKFTIGWAWIDDYGSSDDPEEFKALQAYSPVHNTKPGTAYPATLITTADTDDRVVPGHSFKFAAALQYAQSGDAPVLIRIETRAGHGAGKPTSKRIEEAADQWAFLVRNLGMRPQLK